MWSEMSVGQIFWQHVHFFHSFTNEHKEENKVEVMEAEKVA